jgi:hypothetical protein
LISGCPCCPVLPGVGLFGTQVGHALAINQGGPAQCEPRSGHMGGVKGDNVACGSQSSSSQRSPLCRRQSMRPQSGPWCSVMSTRASSAIRPRPHHFSPPTPTKSRRPATGGAGASDRPLQHRQRRQRSTDVDDHCRAPRARRLAHGRHTERGARLHSRAGTSRQVARQSGRLSDTTLSPSLLRPIRDAGPSGGRGEPPGVPEESSPPD